MSRKSLFTLNNTLPEHPDGWERFDLNPAVVANGGGLAFALSAVCLGPRLGGDAGPLQLELWCDGSPTRLAAIDQRSEETSSQCSLTVAVFDASLRLLGDLAVAETVRVRLTGERGEVERSLGDANREQVERFLDRLHPHPSSAVASIASAAR